MTETDLKSQLKAILLFHRGETGAITSRELCRLFGLCDDRPLRLAIRELRCELPVLSSGKGYYMPASWKDLHDWKASMRSRLIEDARTIRDTMKTGPFYLPPEQGRLV